jgi:ribose transport system permease protein
MAKEIRVAILLAVVCIFVAIKQPAFLGVQNLSNQANLIGIYGIFSIGMGLIIITGGIDLSMGSAFALFGVVFSILYHDRDWNWVLAMAVVLGMSIIMGLIHAFLVVKVRLQPFIVTLCSLLIYRSLARTIADDQAKGLGNDLPVWFERLTHTRYWEIAPGEGGVIPATFILMIVIAVMCWVLLHRSVWGRYLFAVGRNEEAARFSGINTKMVIGSAYVIGMFLAAIAGVLLLREQTSFPPSGAGVFYECYAIAAAVLGGCSLRGGEGSIIGIILGTMLLRILQNMVVLVGIRSSLEFAVMGGVILAGVTVDELLSSRKRKSVAPIPELARPGDPIKKA